MDLTQLLQAAAAAGASDVHVTVGKPPFFRIRGLLFPSSNFPVFSSAQQIEDLMHTVLTPERQEALTAKGEIDFSYSLVGVGRFRVSLFQQRGSLAAALRVIPEGVPSLDELGLPKALRLLALQESGLVLISGGAGSGKSTTLAAMVSAINQERACHILTIEDPIEYLHRHDRSLVNQREVGGDTRSFVAAFRSALREDVDVIALTDVPDLETISMALDAADAGRLVIACVRTQRAHQAIERLIHMFPPHQEEQIRFRLAACFQGAVAQMLLRSTQESGRVLATELLVATPAVRNLIREGKTQQLLSLMDAGGKFGMHRLESSLERLHAENLVDENVYQGRMSELSAAIGWT